MGDLSPEQHASELYESLLRERLREATCRKCGASLESAVVESADGGAVHDDLRLTPASVVQAIAATAHLSVRCGYCGATDDVGAVWVPPAPVRPPAEAEEPWAPEVAAVYAEATRERLKAARCSACGQSLESAEVLRAGGGTLVEDYGLSERSLALTLAATQHISVRCIACGERETVCESCRTTC